MTEGHLPPTGRVEVVDEGEAVEVVEEIAQDAEDAGVVAERLLIALDIDGTVILEDESMSPGVVEAVERAARAGHEVMVATGRSWEGTEHIMRSLGLVPEFVVCSNGAVALRRIGEGPEYERWHVETFDPRPVLAQLRVHLPGARYLVELPDGSRLYTEHLDDWNLARAHRVPFDDLGAQPVCRVVVVAPDHGEEEFVDLIESIGLHGVSYAVGWTAWLDIAPQGVDKGTALERVRMALGIDPARVLVIGDGRNDLGMFRWALEHGGRAVAMEQGPDEVRTAAGEITTSVQAGGVAEVLRRL